MELERGERIPIVDDRPRTRAWPAHAASSTSVVPGDLGLLIGQSAAMRELGARIARVAASRCTVLLTGETGTGKGRVAQAIHAASPRAERPFVAVHCAALSETLLESELFGHERGAFTGAHARREGRFAMADGGTLFLDEIGEISPATQVKLLRVLQERKFERVGSNETVAVDVRLVAATNRDLMEMVALGHFRADLYYRLNVVALEMPPLRARREDIPLLAEHTLARLARESGGAVPRIEPAALQALMGYDWPGNVRELENLLEHALVMSGGEITAASLAPRLWRTGPSSPPPPSDGMPAPPQVPGASFADIERHAILATYEACGRNALRTAEVLGISARTVHYRLREYRGQPGRRRAMAGFDPRGEPALAGGDDPDG